jgi:hypothetical protein
MIGVERPGAALVHSDSASGGAVSRFLARPPPENSVAQGEECAVGRPCKCATVSDEAGADGGSGQQLGMPKGYPFVSSSGPNFGTRGLGSSSGRPIVFQSFGA